MRIIWIMSRPLLGTLGTPKQNHTGSWVDAAFDGLKDIEDVEIHAIYMAKNCQEQIEHVGRHFVYKLPKEQYCNLKKIEFWKRLESRIQPDLMMVWGSEQGVALPPVTALTDIPRVVYIQGLLNNIVVNFNGGLTTLEILSRFAFQISSV